MILKVHVEVQMDFYAIEINSILTNLQLDIGPTAFEMEVDWNKSS